MNPSDPEDIRIAELLDKIGRGLASQAEQEELELYRQERRDIPPAWPRSPELRSSELLEKPSNSPTAWLDRVQADQQIEKIYASPWATAQRKIGLSLFIFGMVATWFYPAVGAFSLLAGMSILLGSALYIRLKSH